MTDQANKLREMALSGQHTPGPWKATGNEIWTDYPGVPLKVATATRFAPMNGIDTDANARLIAAAPELLKAIELILPLAKGYSPGGQFAEARATTQQWINFAVETAAKARGASE